MPQSSRAPSESGSIISNAVRRFQRARVKITAQLNSLETDEEVHTKELKERVKIVKENFKALRINEILDRFLYDPNQDEIYGAFADEIDDWSELCDGKIEELKIRAERQISQRKAATQSGFEKRSYPKFKGEKLTYYVFKEK